VNRINKPKEIKMPTLFDKQTQEEMLDKSWEINFVFAAPMGKNERFANAETYDHCVLRADW
jgi:hypothetical protein